MNTETQLLVKMVYAESVAKVLRNSATTESGANTLEWIRQEAGRIIEKIMQPDGKMVGVTPEAYQWAKRADMCKEHLKSLIDDFHDDTDIPEEQQVFYTLSVLTQMVDDLSRVPSKGHWFNDMSLAAYNLEHLLKLPKRMASEDVVREHAGAYLKKFYSKMDSF